MTPEEKAALEAAKKQKEAEGDDDKGYRTQEDFDKAFSAKLNKEREKLKAENEAIVKKALEDAKAEAERQAKLSEDERRKEQDAQREEELKKLKDENALLTNKATATTLLEERGIPLSLLDYVVDVDADKTKENIDTFDTAFSKAVQEAVDKKLAGKTPQANSDDGEKAGPKHSGVVSI